MMEPMMLKIVYNNIKGHDYDIEGYRLCKAEAECLMKLIEEKMDDKRQEDDGK